MQSMCFVLPVTGLLRNLWARTKPWRQQSGNADCVTWGASFLSLCRSHTIFHAHLEGAWQDQPSASSPAFSSWHTPHSRTRKLTPMHYLTSLSRESEPQNVNSCKPILAEDLPSKGSQGELIGSECDILHHRCLIKESCSVRSEQGSQCKAENTKSLQPKSENGSLLWDTFVSYSAREQSVTLDSQLFLFSHCFSGC